MDAIDSKKADRNVEVCSVPSIAVDILFHVHQLFHIIAVICLPVIDIEKELDSEQGHANHVPCKVLYVLRFVNPKKFDNRKLHLGPIRIKVN